jgi:hypothetical protein
MGTWPWARDVFHLFNFQVPQQSAFITDQYWLFPKLTGASSTESLCGDFLLNHQNVSRESGPNEETIADLVNAGPVVTPESGIS